MDPNNQFDDESYPELLPDRQLPRDSGQADNYDALPPQSLPPINNLSPQQSPPPMGNYSNQSYYNPNYAQPSNGLATTGLVLILISIFLFWAPFITTVLWIVAVILAFTGLSKAKQLAGSGQSMAIVTLVIAAVTGIIYAGIIAYVISNWDEISQELNQSEFVNISDEERYNTIRG